MPSHPTPPPTLSVVIRGESFRSVSFRSVSRTGEDVISLQAAASRSHTAMLSVLCNNGAWHCTVTLCTYRPEVSGDRLGVLQRLYHGAKLRLFTYNSFDKSPWWGAVFAAERRVAFALLDLRFDMVIKRPEWLGAYLWNATASAQTGESPSTAHLLVLFRTASHITRGLVKDGPRAGSTYRIRLRCPHLTRRGRPRVADTLHLTPKHLFGLAARGFFDEDVADRLATPKQLRWISPELADSDTWKCSNQIYVLNSRPSNSSLSPQKIGITPGAPPAQPLRSCPNYSLPWWPELSS